MGASHCRIPINLPVERIGREQSTERHQDPSLAITISVRKEPFFSLDSCYPHKYWSQSSFSLSCTITSIVRAVSPFFGFTSLPLVWPHLLADLSINFAVFSPFGDETPFNWESHEAEYVDINDVVSSSATGSVPSWLPFSCFSAKSWIKNN